MQSRIACRVQHHPSRADLIPDLLDRLEGLPVDVVCHESDPPSPWGGYQECLRNPPDCSHLLVVQDDAQPCLNFVPVLRQIAAVHPDVPVCFFVAWLPRREAVEMKRAMQHGRRYVTISLRSFLPLIAVLWPVEKAREFMAWADENPTLPAIREPRSDDAMAGRWKMMTRQRVLATVPSLVEHPDTVPSTVGKRAAWGKDKGRVAQFLAADALDYDWG